MPLTLLLALAVQASAAPSEWALTVREVMERAEAYDGREIVVTGWIDRCERLSCALYASREEAKKESPRYWLSIGASAWFDAFARRRAPGRITLRARLDDRCVTDPADDIIAICADRVNSLNPLAVVK
jgi:hypothetical protein